MNEHLDDRGKDYSEHDYDEQLERYLDGALLESEQEQWEQRLQDEPELREIVAAEAKAAEDLKRRLQQQFQASTVLSTAELVAGLERRTTKVEVKHRSSSGRRVLLAVMLSGIAAMLAWILATTGGSRSVTPYFEQRPLAQLYRETVASGFRPYYFCEDPERFERTFRKRQQTPLLLAELPSDRRMVGLSYPGGLSRETTAMLGYVDEHPVMVFVDQRSKDNESLATSLESSPDAAPADSELFVHRAVLGNLVFYEVSPLNEPMLTQFFQIAQQP